MYNGLHIKYRLFLSDFREIWIFSTDFGRMFKNKISWKPSSGSRIVPCGRTDTRQS